jgi:hypothetical protein
LEKVKKWALAALIYAARFDMRPEELVTHAAKATSSFVTPLRLMKRVPLAAGPDPTIARAMNYDATIWCAARKM